MPTATATNPLPASSPNMHTRLVYKDKNQKFFLNAKKFINTANKSRVMPILEIPSLTSKALIQITLYRVYSTVQYSAVLDWMEREAG